MILICNSTAPKLGEGGCCGEKNTEALYAAVGIQLAKMAGFEQEEVRMSACMRNCRQGISVRILPQNQVYGNVIPDDIPELLTQVLAQKKALTRLLVVQENRFLGF